MPRIFLIEDDLLVREDLSSELAEAGYAVTSFDGGEKALPEIISNPPDVIVTDIIMEEGEGMGVLATTKEHHPNVPVIVISANQNYLKYAAALGAKHTLQKPVSPKMLIDLLRS